MRTRKIEPGRSASTAQRALARGRTFSGVSVGDGRRVWPLNMSDWLHDVSGLPVDLIVEGETRHQCFSTCS